MGYRHGDRLAICDMCGFCYHLSKLRKRWDGLLVCRKDWELEPPQNYIRIYPERADRIEGRPEHADIVAADLWAASLLLEEGGYLVLEDGTRIIL